ncbi:hypothetical protein [Pseudofrankia sp. DC12]|uniref:hypothetical protein n=1 Tax=Pseudofrankia sp. DC12 TaxID=683315 RepID=UPI000A52DDF1|nr:hypothetical protein [Pseudofrankia sp. DC12]
MAHWYCPDCRTTSQEVGSQAEAKQLLQTHQRHFCRPARPVQRPTSTPAARPARTGRR